MGKKILIADDAAIMRLMLTNILTQAGYEIAGEASTGREAVDRYQEKKPDLVTMDITMPEMDGIQAVKAIKALDPQAKVVMCSAMGQKTLVLEAIEAGAMNFIVKPFENQKVIEVISKAIG